MSNFTCESKSFINIFSTCQVSACELQPFSCHKLANDIYSETAKTVFSHLNCFTSPVSFTGFYTECEPVLHWIHTFSLLALVTCMFPASFNGCYFLAFCIACLFSRVLHRLHVFPRPYTQVACFPIPGSCKCGRT